ncbi:MAG: excinuclease ABC subunit UvrC [Brevinemataceae bacterium]
MKKEHTITKQILGSFSPKDKNDIPEDPGVYIYKDTAGKILYIGKAKNLRKRVNSYFMKTPQFLKTHLLVQQINIIDIIIVGNESEALLLEATLIKKHLPKFNINFKDGKFYPYIKITVKEKFPRLFMTRNKFNDGSLYFGPYISAGIVRSNLDILQKIFQLRICRTLPKRECLEYHMGRCSAPCIQKITEKQYMKSVQEAIEFLTGKKDKLIKNLEKKMKTAAKELLFEKAQIYKEQLDSIHSLDEQQSVYLDREDNTDIIGISGNNSQFGIAVSLIRNGKLTGKEGFTVTKKDADSIFSENSILEEFIITKYSEAENLPKRIIIDSKFAKLAEFITIWFQDEGSGLSVETPQEENSPESVLLSLAEKNALIHLEREISEPDLLETLHRLQQEFNLKNFPGIIEGFDIAKLDGTLASGVNVCFQGGEPDKKSYRTFNIQAENQQDDYAAMEELVYRRLHRILTENQALPHLLVIDGGKGQLAAALNALEKLHIQDIDVISIAKQHEEIFLPGNKTGIILPENSSVLNLIKRIRDESHRFSQHHLHRRMDKKLKS